MNSTYFEVLKINEAVARAKENGMPISEYTPPPGNPLRSASLPDRGSHLPDHLDQSGKLGQLCRRLRQCRSGQQIQDS